MLFLYSTLNLGSQLPHVNWIVGNTGEHLAMYTYSMEGREQRRQRRYLNPCRKALADGGHWSPAHDFLQSHY